MRIVSDGTSIGTEIFDDDGKPFDLYVRKIEWIVTGERNPKAILHVWESEDSTDTIRYFPIGKVSVDLKVKPENVKVVTE